MEEKNLIFLGFDVALAVQAKIALMLEAHTFEENQGLVWNPTQELLADLARKHPTYLQCIHGPPHTIKTKMQKGSAMDVYIAGAGIPQKLAYLGTIVDRQRAQSIYDWFLNYSPDNEEKIRLKGPMAITTWWLMRSIPVDSDSLGQPEAEEGIKKYLKESFPALARLPIRWLSLRQQAALEQFVSSRAKILAHRQTKAERSRIFEADL